MQNDGCNPGDVESKNEAEPMSGQGDAPPPFGFGTTFGHAFGRDIEQLKRDAAAASIPGGSN